MKTNRYCESLSRPMNHFICGLSRLFLLALLILVASIPRRLLAETSAHLPLVVEGRNFRCSIDRSSDAFTATCQATSPKNTFAKVDFLVLADPDRLAVDLPDFDVGKASQAKLEPTALLVGVRTGRQPTGARVVFDLRGSFHHGHVISADGRTLTITLSSATGEATSVQREPNIRPSVPAAHVSPTPTAMPTLSGAPPRIARPERKETAGALSSTISSPVLLAPRILRTALPESARSKQEGAKLASEKPVPQPSAQDTPGVIATPSSAISPLPTPSLQVVPADSFKSDDIVRLSDSIAYVSMESEDRPIKDIGLRNSGSSPLAVQSTTSVVSVSNGVPEFGETTAFDASPRRVVLAPGETKTIRLVFSSERSAREEFIYRVGFSIDREENAQPGKLSADVTQSESRDVSLFVAVPGEDVRDNVDVGLDGQNVRFDNTGTRMVSLSECENCPATEPRCSPLPSRFLFVKETMKVQVSGDGFVQCRATVGRRSSKLTKNYGALEIK